jgi:hypothetical protein
MVQAIMLAYFKNTFTYSIYTFFVAFLLRIPDILACAIPDAPVIPTYTLYLTKSPPKWIPITIELYITPDHAVIIF